MHQQIQSCKTLKELREIVYNISINSTSFNNIQLFILDDMIAKKEVELRINIKKTILELRDLAQQLFDWKEYNFSNVYTEFAEEYIYDLNINIWGHI